MDVEYCNCVCSDYENSTCSKINLRVGRYYCTYQCITFVACYFDTTLCILLYYFMIMNNDYFLFIRFDFCTVCKILYLIIFITLYSMHLGNR